MSDAGELKLNPNYNQTIQRYASKQFFISCLPYSDQAQGISDSRVRAKELSWRKLRLPPEVPVAEWVVMGTSHDR